MSSRLQYLFELDRQLRVYLRFLIESFSILSVYILCVMTSDVLGQLSIAIHVANAVIWTFAYKTLGLHKDRLRFSSIVSYLPIIKMSLASVLILAIESVMFTSGLDIIALLLYGLFSLNLLVGLRVLARQLIRRAINHTRENILVYGTSDIAIDLVNAMAFGKKYNVTGFVSDRPQSIGSLAGLPVVPMKSVEEFARSNRCELIVIASNSLSPKRETEILQQLDKLGISVSYAPTMDRAFDYEVKLKAVKPEDVLGRASEIQLDAAIQVELNNKTVLVTGAGGSIGSEVCRQILRYQPEKLVVLELSELALYTLEQEISELLVSAGSQTHFTCYLGSVTNKAALNRIFNDHAIDIVYHAAAYKHVPIVEDNVSAGITNNVFGTKCVAEFAHRFGTEKFVLVSTDKAVRPTNVMGASKRLAELVIQDLSKSSETIFTMVRFGNVLGSSGSVIPKFKKQINAGGPITVTHEEITRYFMSIPEAAHLVLNAGAFANGGDVFLLDMGDPVKIVELAKSMVRQHGLQPVLASDISGRPKRDNEILIEFSGLRPGEKLYEELLVDGEAQDTPNPKVFKSYDGILGELDLENSLRLLQENIDSGDAQAILGQLRELPLSYQSSEAVAVTPTNHDIINEAKTEISEASPEQNYSRNTIAEREHTSLLQRAVSSKFGLALLHRYFFLTRGMTLGVRVLVQNPQGEILLVKHSYLPGWYLPGGGVDHGEDVATAAKREVYEETGISELESLKLIYVEHNNAVSPRDHVTYFKARTNMELDKTLSAEISDTQFVSRDLACEIVVPEHKKYILENS
ncbi:polysaccharide biosynthesis protein [Planktomarina temperata]|nr:polysaccharide biosynthesis protein [Planktomarina temperata]